MSDAPGREGGGAEERPLNIVLPSENTFHLPFT